ncbi:MAG: hypothetical protein RL026_2258 [Pseudomonadota bacterium]|jgi:hypothetical protein
MSYRWPSLSAAGNPPAHHDDTMNRKHLLLPALLATTLPLHAFAQDTSGGAGTLSYDFVSASYETINVSDVDSDATGYGLSVSKSLGDAFFIAVNAVAVELEDDYVNADTQSYGLSLGYHHALADNVDVVLSGGAVHQRLQSGGGEASATGGQAGLGLRAAVAPSVELAAGVSHVRIEGEAATSFGASARYLFTPNFSVGAGVGSADGASSYGVSVRLQF